MHKHPLIAAAAICAFALAAPAAAAQTGSFNGTYAGHYPGPRGNPPCPNGGFLCGAGTAGGFGPFTDVSLRTGPSNALTTLAFADGSTLVLAETIVADRTPGNSGSSNQPGFAFGHPGNQVWDWVVTGGTGTFAAATGSGTDDIKEAGGSAFGDLNGTITTP
jgi:hypothetical protein